MTDLSSTMVEPRLHRIVLDGCGAASPAPSDVEFVLLTERPEWPPPETVSQACRSILADHRTAVVIVPRSPSGTLAGLWRTLPVEVASIFEAPTPFGWLVVARSSELFGQPITRDAVWNAFRTIALEERVELSLVDAGESDDEPGPVRLPLLVPSCPVELPDSVRSWIKTSGQGGGGAQPDSPENVAVQAGLLLWQDRLDESHRRSQTVEGEGKNSNADYWHAVMHRREPDYSNAKYWFRAVRRHPVFEPLAKSADRIFAGSSAPEATRWRGRVCPGGGWDPFAFVDLCEACARDESTPLAITARKIQRAEMLLLFERSCADAGCGGG